MRIRNIRFHGRQAWQVQNDVLSVVLLRGGGHIASVSMNKGPATNPLWRPVWGGIEPWKYSEKLARKYATKLLASICGHNLCLPWFGAPSEAELRAGSGGHGEAPVARWQVVRRRTNARAVSFTYGCRLPASGMTFERTVTLRKGSAVVRVRERVRNRTRRDIPYTMCEHVTFGPPFLEKGVTVFDMPATRCHTYPWEFEPLPRLRRNAAFTWPKGPGIRGRTVDMRMIGAETRASSDFSTQLIDPRRTDAWFSAVNPRLGLLMAYVWRREDFPWVGNWEENYGRKKAPWAGRSLTRGMEFANTAFPHSLRRSVEMGRFHGLPTYRWLAARGTFETAYDMILMEVPGGCGGVEEVRRAGDSYVIDLKG